MRLIQAFFLFGFLLNGRVVLSQNRQDCCTCSSLRQKTDSTGISHYYTKGNPSVLFTGTCSDFAQTGSIYARVIREYSEGILIKVDYYQNRNQLLRTEYFPKDDSTILIRYDFNRVNQLFGSKKVYKKNSDTITLTSLYSTFDQRLYYSSEFHSETQTETKKSFYPDGTLLLLSYYKNNRRDSIEQEWYEDGSIQSECFFKEGKNEGSEKRWSQDGTLISETYYHEGLINGIKRTWYPDGMIHTEEHYSEGSMNGQSVAWFSNGKLSSVTNFKNGKENGTCKYWNEHGRLIIIGTYKNGELDGRTRTYSETGQIESDEHYDHGKLTGKCRYFIHGIKIKEVDCDKGKINGAYKLWFGNGNPRLVFHYHNNIREGECVRYNLSGQVIFRRNYRNGIPEGTYPKEIILSDTCHLPDSLAFSACQKEIDKLVRAFYSLQFFVQAKDTIDQTTLLRFLLLQQSYRAVRQIDDILGSDIQCYHCGHDSFPVFEASEGYTVFRLSTYPDQFYYVYADGEIDEAITELQPLEDGGMNYWSFKENPEDQ